MTRRIPRHWRRPFWLPSNAARLESIASSSSSPAPVRRRGADVAAAGGSGGPSPAAAPSPRRSSRRTASGTAGAVGAPHPAPASTASARAVVAPPAAARAAGCLYCAGALKHHQSQCRDVEQRDVGRVTPPDHPTHVSLLGNSAPDHTDRTLSAGRATSVACEPVPALSADAAAPYMAVAEDRVAQPS